MKRPLLITAVLALVALGLGGGAAYWLIVRRPPPPDFDRVGGTVLVFQVDADAPGPGDVKELPRILKERLDPNDRSYVQIALEDPDRVRIAIPRTGDDHEDYVRQVKELLAQVGHLEFRILANTEDDKDAIAWAQHWFEDLKEKDARAQELKRRAERGLPPPPPPAEPGTKFTWNTGHAKGEADYQWVEMGRSQRKSMRLDAAAAKDPDPAKRDLWERAAKARDQGVPLVMSASDLLDRTLLYSRNCVNLGFSPEERQSKGYDYFLLTRAEGPAREVTGRFLERAFEGPDHMGRSAIQFRLNDEGGNRFYEITSANRPSGEEFGHRRQLAIILDDQILSAPRLQSAIRSDCQITGDFTPAQIKNLVNILRSGALPVRLKPLPVEEITVGPR